MDVNQISWVSLWGAWGVTVGTLWVLFSRAEKVASHDFRLRVKRWLQGDLSVEGKIERWPDTFERVFDNVFGEKHLSWRCFWRSCVASFVGVTIMSCIWIAINPDAISFYIRGIGSDAQRAFVLFFAIGLAGGFLNLFPDYCSLLETRAIIQRMKSTKTMAGLLGLIVLDCLLTITIFLIPIFLLFILYDPLDEGISRRLNILVRLGHKFLWLSAHEPGEIPMGIFFYSTFFTSIWVWLYALSGMVVRGFTAVFKGINFFKRLLDLDKQPILALGAMSIVIVTVLFLVAAPFILLT